MSHDCQCSLGVFPVVRCECAMHDLLSSPWCLCAVLCCACRVVIVFFCVGVLVCISRSFWCAWCVLCDGMWCCCCGVVLLIVLLSHELMAMFQVTEKKATHSGGRKFLLFFSNCLREVKQSSSRNRAQQNISQVPDTRYVFFRSVVMKFPPLAPLTSNKNKKKIYIYSKYI